MSKGIAILNENLAPQSGVLPHGHRQHNIFFEVKLFNCFNAMGQNINKHRQVCTPVQQSRFYLYLAVSHVDGTMIHCLNMVKKM